MAKKKKDLPYLTRGPNLLIGFTRKMVFAPVESVPYLTLKIKLISNIFYICTSYTNQTEMVSFESY